MTNTLGRTIRGTIAVVAMRIVTTTFSHTTKISIAVPRTRAGKTTTAVTGKPIVGTTPTPVTMIMIMVTGTRAATITITPRVKAALTSPSPVVLTPAAEEIMITATTLRFAAF
jgi:hypothetical protein